MDNIAYKIIFLLFSIYTLIYTSSYGIHEIKKENNTYGGFMVIFCTIFSIAFGNIVIWIR